MAESNVPLDEECFFIGPIGEDGSEERKRSDGVLNFIVQDAVKELGLTAVRADQIGMPGQITLQVLTHVLGAKAAVADLTGLNANVFYELAVRHTARLPVVLIAAKGQKLPFDIAQMRTIFFDHKDLADAARCRDEIVRHLREALAGSLDSPIATALGIQQLATGSTMEQVLGQLLERVDQLAVDQDDIREGVDRLQEFVDGAALPRVLRGNDALMMSVGVSNAPNEETPIHTRYILGTDGRIYGVNLVGDRQIPLLPEVDELIRRDEAGESLFDDVEIPPS